MVDPVGSKIEKPSATLDKIATLNDQEIKRVVLLETMFFH